MYHHVGPLPPNPDIFRKDLTVPPEVFDQTLDRLADQGIAVRDLPGHPYLRASVGAWNDESDLERLLKAL